MYVDINSKKEQAQKILDRAEEINRTTKNFKQYFVDMILMLDTFYKNQLKSTKGTMSSIVFEDREHVSFSIMNLYKYFQDLINSSQTKLNELDNSDFNLENIKKGKKSIIENTKNSEKKLEKCYDAFVKNQQKYEKQVNEFNTKYGEYQKAQKTGYNITLSKKQETKIRLFVKEIEQQEQLLQQIIAELNSSLSVYSQTLKVNFNQMKVLFSESVESVLELIKQFALIQQKITEGVIQSIDTVYLPHFQKIVAASKSSKQNTPETQSTQLPTESPDTLRLVETDRDINHSQSDLNGQANNNAQELQSNQQLAQNRSRSPSFSKINFVISLQSTLEKFESQIQHQSEESIRLYYYEQVKALFDRFKKYLEDRLKNAKILKQYIGELNESYEFIQKNFVKHMANRYKTADTALSAKYTEVLNVLHFIIEGLSDTFKQLSNFTNSKANSMNGLINEYGNMDKALTYLFHLIQKSQQLNDNGLLLQKEYQSMIMGSLTKIMNQERNSAKIIYSCIHSIFSEMHKMQHVKKQFLQKAIDNVVMSQDEVKDQIQAFFTKDEQMFDVQEKKLNGQEEKVVFLKLFVLPEEFRSDYQVEQKQKQIDELNNITSPLKDTSKSQDSVKISSSLIKKFNVPQNDFVVDSFSCSYSSKISLHGKIYIFNTMIGFHSSFNSRTLIGDTVLVIPYHEISHIEKKSQALIFDNAISITTKKGTLVFTAFMNRDRCYRLIRSQMEQYNNLKERKNDVPKKKTKKDSMDSSESEESDFEDENDLEDSNENEDQQEENDNNNDNLENSDQQQEENIEQKPEFPPIIPDEFKQKMEERKQRILASNTKNYFTNTEAEKYELVIENTHTREVFMEVFGDKPYKDFPSFTHYYQQTHILDTKIDITQWSPSPHQIFTDIKATNYEDFLNSNESSTKTTSFVHPVREKVPMGPKSCQVNSEEKIFWLTPDEVLIQREFKVSKVPMADCFTQQNFYYIQMTGPSTVKLTFGFFINFVKSSMFKKLILKSSSSENRDTWNDKFKNVIVEHLKSVQTSRASQQTELTQKKGRGGVGRQKPIKISKTDKIIALNQQSIDNLTAINNEIINMDGSVNICNEKQQNFMSQQTTFFYLLIGLVAINFLLLFK